MMMAGIFMILLVLALVGFTLMCHWKVYAKAGKPGWACIVPIYNFII